MMLRDLLDEKPIRGGGVDDAMDILGVLSEECLGVPHAEWTMGGATPLIKRGEGEPDTKKAGDRGLPSLWVSTVF